jgi:hypothetical protein
MGHSVCDTVHRQWSDSWLLCIATSQFQLIPFSAVKLIMFIFIQVLYWNIWDKQLVYSFPTVRITTHYLTYCTAMTVQSLHWLGYMLQLCSITVQFPAVSRDLSALPNNKPSSRTHTFPSSTDNKGSYSRGSAARLWSQLLTRSSQISVTNLWSCTFMECTWAHCYYK